MANLKQGLAAFNLPKPPTDEPMLVQPPVAPQQAPEPPRIVPVEPKMERATGAPQTAPEAHGQAEIEGRGVELLSAPKPINSDAESTRKKGARATQAQKQNKRFVNVLIDKDLAIEAQVRMQFRDLSWDSLMQSLLNRWVNETPERPTS